MSKPVKRRYTAEEIIELRQRPRQSLNPSEFLVVFRSENAEKQAHKLTHSNRNTDDELYDVYLAIPSARLSSNRLKKAIGEAGMSVSHDRAARLFKQFKIKAGLEGDLDGSN